MNEEKGERERREVGQQKKISSLSFDSHSGLFLLFSSCCCSLCRHQYSRGQSIVLWIFVEFAIIGADLQAVVGCAVSNSQASTPLLSSSSSS